MGTKPEIAVPAMTRINALQDGHMLYVTDANNVVRGHIRKEDLDRQYGANGVVVAGAPTIVTPAMGATLPGADFTLTWTNNDTYTSIEVIADNGGATEYHRATIAGTATSHLVTGIALDGSFVNVRVIGTVAGQPVEVSTSYVAFRPPSAPVITAPASGTTLTETQFTLAWSNQDAYDALQVVVDDGATTLFTADPANTETQQLVTGMPQDGRALTARVRYTINGVTDESSIPLIASSLVLPPVIGFPVNGATLNAQTVQLTWTNPEAYDSIQVSSDDCGTVNFFVSQQLGGTETTVLVTGLPDTGGPVCIRVSAVRNGVTVTTQAQYIGFTQTATPGAPTITPANNTQIQAATQEYAAQLNGAPVSTWELKIGSAPDFDNYMAEADKGFTTPAVRSAWTAISLPQDGSFVHVTLNRIENGTFITDRYQYTSGASALPNTPSLIAPVAGSTIAGTNMTVEFASGGTAVTTYDLLVGSTLGGNDFANIVGLPPATTSQTITNLPTDSSQVFIRWTANHAGGPTVVDRQVTSAAAPAAPVFQVLPRFAALVGTPPVEPPLPGVIRPNFQNLGNIEYNTFSWPLDAFGFSGSPRIGTQRANVFDADFASLTFDTDIAGIDLTTTRIRHSGANLVRGALPAPRQNLVLDLNGATFSGATLHTTGTTLGADNKHFLNGVVFPTQQQDPVTNQVFWDVAQAFGKLDPFRRPVELDQLQPRLGVYLDNVPLIYVQEFTSLAPGRFWVNRTNGQIAINDDPAGRVLETSMRQEAWGRGGDGALICGLENGTIEKFASGIGVAAVGSGTWFEPMTRNYTDITVQLCTGVGIEFASFTTAIRVNASDNGQLGGSVVGCQNGYWEDCDFDRNNWQFTNQGDHAGGLKISAGDFRPVHMMHFVRCRYRNNHGIGKWYDFHVHSFLEYLATATGNERAGIYLEDAHRFAIVQPTTDSNCTYRHGGLNGFLGGEIVGHNSQYGVIIDPDVTTGTDAGVGLLQSSGAGIQFINQDDGSRVDDPSIPTFKTPQIWDWDGVDLTFNHPTKTNQQGNSIFGDARTAHVEVIRGTVRLRNNQFRKGGIDASVQNWNINGCFQDAEAGDAGFDILNENAGAGRQMFRGTQIIVEQPVANWENGTPFSDGALETTDAATFGAQQLSEGATITVDGTLVFTAP